ncbi:glycosyltransferase family 2 protein [Leifsonia sp. 2MCAF36]|uniref:glycosyltransferase family 2 protein n=1 Tax=Leifsonia sp. 2MCAF36 TaxID=3232988 RepID=UPI003F97A1A3
MSSPTPRAAAVVTVTYNSNAVIDDFLRSVRADGGNDVEVVVADNGTTDIVRLREIAAMWSATLIELPENVGYGAGMNAAVAALTAEHEHILISNPDVRLAPGALAELSRLLDADPSAGAVGPKILNEDGTVYPSARRLPSLRTGIGHSILEPIWSGNPWTRAYHADATIDVRTSGWLSGACQMVRRAAFDQLGGFDDGYFMYFEDVDLGLRIGQAGWSNVYDPKAVVTHTGAHSTTDISDRMLRIHHESAYRYLAKRYPHWYQAPLRWALKLGLWFRVTVLVTRNRRKVRNARGPEAPADSSRSRS